MDDYEYALECPMCDTYVELTVIDIDEQPVNCPMCGTEVEWETISE